MFIIPEIYILAIGIKIYLLMGLIYLKMDRVFKELLRQGSRA